MENDKLILVGSAVAKEFAEMGIPVKMPERIGWTEWTKENIIYHYSTKDKYEESKNRKQLGIIKL